MKTFREFLEIADMQLDERNRDSPRPDKEEWKKRKDIMRQNAIDAENEASKNKVIQGIRSRRGEPEPKPTPPRVGGAPYTSSGEGLNPEKKPPRPRVVTPYVPPEGTENLAARTAKIRPFGTVYEPPAAPVKRKRG
jgi:hypothetical protein